MEPRLELFLFQEEGIRFASEREGVADEMGLGKSVQAIGVINEDPTIRKVIIILPACEFQGAFKIRINSLYGYLAFPFGHFADFQAAERVTTIGREMLTRDGDGTRAGWPRGAGCLVSGGLGRHGTGTPAWAAPHTNSVTLTVVSPEFFKGVWPCFTASSPLPSTRQFSLSAST